MEIPCKFNCKNRSAVCHSQCGEYKAYRKHMDKQREERRKFNDMETFFSQVGYKRKLGGC